MILDLEEHGGRAVRHSSLLDSSILVLKCDGTILVRKYRNDVGQHVGILIFTQPLSHVHFCLIGTFLQDI